MIRLRNDGWRFEVNPYLTQDDLRAFRADRQVALIQERRVAIPRP